jgi:hypothetical protein
MERARKAQSQKCKMIKETRNIKLAPGRRPKKAGIKRKAEKMEPETSDSMDQMEEEEMSEEAMLIDEQRPASLTEMDMIDQPNILEEICEKNNFGRLPRIYIKDYKKIKTRL